MFYYYVYFVTHDIFYILTVFVASKGFVFDNFVVKSVEVSQGKLEVLANQYIHTSL